MNNSHEHIDPDQLLTAVKQEPTNEKLRLLREFHAEKRFGIKTEGTSISKTYLRIFSKEAKRCDISLSPEFCVQVGSLDSIATAEERYDIIASLWAIALGGFSNMSQLVAQHTVEFSPEEKARIQAEAIKESGIYRSMSSSVISPPDVKPMT